VSTEAYRYSVVGPQQEDKIYSCPAGSPAGIPEKGIGVTFFDRLPLAGVMPSCRCWYWVLQIFKVIT